MTVRIGDTIAGQYRVERVLGRGGMGVVVAARHQDLGWLRAIKVMHPEPAGRPSWAERFRREAQVGGRLSSEHAVRVFDVGGFDEGQPFIVMEHLEGTDLGKLLRARGPLPIADAVRYVAQACEALAEAHELGVVHRDLKPANLFVTDGADGVPCVKVLDFGISKSGLEEAPDSLRLTQTGEVIGSPAYMAPEQIRSFRGAGPASDIWALGVILYELMTGRWPFPGKASVEMIAMVLERAPDPPQLHRPEVPAALAAVMLRCLEKDPARRMPSAVALRDALAPFVPLLDPGAAVPLGEDQPTMAVRRGEPLPMSSRPLPPRPGSSRSAPPPSSRLVPSPALSTQPVPLRPGSSWPAPPVSSQPVPPRPGSAQPASPPSSEPAPPRPGSSEPAPPRPGSSGPALPRPGSSEPARLLPSAIPECEDEPTPSVQAAPAAPPARQPLGPPLSLVTMPLPPPPTLELVEPPPPSVQTTAPPISLQQRTLPLPLRVPVGPSTRVVLLVAAGSLGVMVIAFAALIHSTTAPSEPVRAGAMSDGAEAGLEAAEAGAGAGPVTEVGLQAAEAGAGAEVVEAGAEPPVAGAEGDDAGAGGVDAGGGAAVEPGAAGAEPGARWSGGPAARASAEPRAGGSGRHLDPGAALSALGGAAGAAKRCKKPGGPKGSGRVDVTFSPSGRVSSVRVGAPFEGTPVGKCISGVFQGISVPAFEGSSFSAGKTVTIK
jgi:serine/threonine-protein kinase